VLTPRWRIPKRDGGYGGNISPSSPPLHGRLGGTFTAATIAPLTVLRKNPDGGTGVTRQAVQFDAGSKICGKTLWVS